MRQLIQPHSIHTPGAAAYSYHVVLVTGSTAATGHVSTTNDRTEKECCWLCDTLVSRAVSVHNHTIAQTPHESHTTRVDEAAANQSTPAFGVSSQSRFVPVVVVVNNQLPPSREYWYPVTPAAVLHWKNLTPSDGETC